MSRQDEGTPAPRRGSSEKRQAIIRGARTVFGREGYTRAGIDAIAKEAGVSTRTIYNHFTDKNQLFLTVLMESTEQVRDAQLELIDRYLGRVVDLEADLLDLGRAWAAQPSKFHDHFALVRQISAEAGHLPTDVITAWRDTGPRTVRTELASRLQQLADRGLLEIDDADRAASHLGLLTSTEVINRTFWGALPISEAETDAIVTAGIRAFLRAYRPR